MPTAIKENWLNIRIIAHPEPFPVSYHQIFDITPKILDEFNPDIVLHIGLAVERKYYAIERGAARDGYYQYPDTARKVFTKAETKKAWSKSPDRLDSVLDFDAVLPKWKEAVGKGVDLRSSDDVGTFVCGFMYYTSMEHMWQKGKGDVTVVFLHLPPLPSPKDIERGKNVVLALIRTLAETC